MLTLPDLQLYTCCIHDKVLSLYHTNIEYNAKYPYGFAKSFNTQWESSKATDSDRHAEKGKKDDSVRSVHLGIMRNALHVTHYALQTAGTGTCPCSLSWGKQFMFNKVKWLCRSLAVSEDVRKVSKSIGILFGKPIGIS